MTTTVEQLEAAIHDISGVARLLREAVTTDGDHHKQWYLERIAELLGIELLDHEIGIAP